MNFEATDRLLEAIKTYTENATVTISTDNKDWLGRPEKSDLTAIGEDLAFEVFENEIIVFCLGDHCHFEDYSSDLQEGEDDYVKRAKSFLIELFENRIKHVEIYKGKKLACERYYIVFEDDREEYFSGTMWRVISMLCPFAKKSEIITVWKFDKIKGHFLKE